MKLQISMLICGLSIEESSVHEINVCLWKIVSCGVYYCALIYYLLVACIMHFYLTKTGSQNSFNQDIPVPRVVRCEILCHHFFATFISLVAGNVFQFFASLSMDALNIVFLGGKWCQFLLRNVTVVFSMCMQ
ncbi:hypothetical protein PMAYCL1PPCAC_09897 [Pristionchus mayeri]|uniref:Uncharacterized protein n=1 Tax=Pristionchus mayeri TaxID=1317129 RepID=A0AAN4ZK94_9BILA|nr:hypothetical protein PMAYCL1PPCAC_09897 [Pristionchus mayeri]